MDWSNSGGLTGSFQAAREYSLMRPWSRCLRPNTDCSISIGYPSAPGLDSATSDAAGNASWTWTVAKYVRPDSWPITVSCRTRIASTQITVS
jgi:hypothetical protein